jgi:hypothetical protein
VAGLWVAGALLSGALRVAWVSGALPVLGAAMAGEPRGAAGFAGGVAGGFLRVLPAAVLGFVLELSGALFAATLALASVMLAGRGGGTGAVVGLAAATAAALTLALAVPMALSTVADALVVRAALRRERPGAALVGVTRRFVARPGAFLVGALLFGTVGVAAQLSVQALGSLALGFVWNAPSAALLGPRLMLGALSALLAGVVDLLWLGTLAVLTCGEASGEQATRSAVRRASATPTEPAAA